MCSSDLESDEHVSLMLTHTDEYESRIVEFLFTGLEVIIQEKFLL